MVAKVTLLEDFFAEVASPLISNLKFDYVGGLVQKKSVSKTGLKTFVKGGEYIIVGKLEQNKKQDNDFLSIKVVGDGRKGPFERNFSQIRSKIRKTCKTYSIQKEENC